VVNIKSDPLSEAIKIIRPNALSEQSTELGYID